MFETLLLIYVMSCLSPYLCQIEQLALSRNTIQLIHIIYFTARENVWNTFVNLYDVLLVTLLFMSNRATRSFQKYNLIIHIIYFTLLAMFYKEQ